MKITVLMKRKIKDLLITHLFEKRRMRFPTFDKGIHRSLILGDDYTRYTAVGLALARVREEKIEGALAEAGVYRGAMSRFIHTVLPERQLYLFDTFEGFPRKDLKGRTDERFRDTSVEAVLKTIGNAHNIVIRKGYVPETFAGLENERFSFVLLDLDLHAPILAGLRFFYPRLSPGGYCMVHDFNNLEWECRSAVLEFLKDKPECPVELPDYWGSVVFRKARGGA